MIMGVKLDPKHYKSIKAFVEKGTYESIESFVEMAIINQILLEESGSSAFRGNKEIEMTPKSEIDAKLSQAKKPANAQPSGIQILGCPKDAQIPFLPAVAVNPEIGSFPIWGQINRFAPAKIVLRMLANQVLSNSDRIVDLKRFSADAAETATSVRSLIEKRDKKKRIRGTELFIALPQKDPNSQQRFLNYYVGKLPSGKWTDGILTGLGLARIEQSEEGSIVIGLTESGRLFGCLSSPLIDDFLVKGTNIDQPFSRAEVDFLLKQLELNRPGEVKFMTAILKFIKSGSNTPTVLREKAGLFLRGNYPKNQFSDKFVNTMLVGLMGRLVELHLVEIEKDAQKSKYLTTEVGEKLIDGGIKHE